MKLFRSTVMTKIFAVCLMASALSVCTISQANAELSAGETLVRAAEGDANAQYNLAVSFFNGGPEKYEMAVHWFKQAAEQGHVGAQNFLGMIYFSGAGIPLDYELSVYWYTKAAEQGDAESQVALGMIYYSDKFVPKDYIYSYAWTKLAALQGQTRALKHMEKVAAALTPQQLAKAQELAAEIQVKINQGPNIKYDQASKHEPEIKGSGTGFFITRDGYLLTCFHVIEDAVAVKVNVGGDIKPAKVILTDMNNDLALLKISGTFSALAFSPKRTATMGEEVFTIGYPNPILQGVNPKLTKGAINSLTGFMDDLRLYQISIPVQPGNSGGPLLDENGNIYGVVVAMLDAETAFKTTGSLPQNVNYAVKNSYAQALLDTLPDVIDNLSSPKSNHFFDDVVKRVGKSIVMVLAYK
jgi:S1-C subfamily serine protease